MAGLVQYDAAYGVLKSAFVTADLDAKTTGSYAGFGTGADAVIDNTTLAGLWIDVLINLGSITPSSSTNLGVALSVLQSMDGGTSYADPQSAAAPPAATPTWGMGVTNGASAKVIFIPFVRIGPGKARLLFLNNTGQTLATGGNTIKYWFSKYQDNG